MSKERPILFSAPMVCALLAGTKTQTRRVMKKQPEFVPIAGAYGLRNMIGILDICHKYTLEQCPYGLVGDHLWVRESFWGCDLPGYGDQPCVVYDDEWQGDEYKPAEARPWGREFGRIPSINMPRESSRITLEIVSVRIERLQGISEEDAMAEGVTCKYVIVGTNCNGGHHNEEYADRYYYCGGREEGAESAVDAYAELWEEINGPGSWGINPWVWVVSFKRVEQ